MSFNINEVEQLLADTGRLCCICHTLHDVATHHIIPIKNGGSNAIDNAILLCPNCHNSVHVKYAPGRVTRQYTPSELKLHRQRTIEAVRKLPMNEDATSHIIANNFSENEKQKEIIRSQLRGEVEQNLSLLREYKEKLFKLVPASGQMISQQLYEFADLEIPIWRRTVWEAHSSKFTDALTSIEFQNVLAMYGQLDSIIGIKIAFQQYRLEEQEIPAKKSDLIRRNMFNSSMWDGLILYERKITHSKTLIWMEMIEVFKKTLDAGKLII